MKDTAKPLRILPIHLVNPSMDKTVALTIGEELESLIATYGGTIVDRVIQKLDRPDNRTYIGSGKTQEVAALIKEKDIDLVILNAQVKPGQAHALRLEFQKMSPQVEVWDRVDLILNIFDKHAVSSEAKLQIELARIGHMGPRIYGMGYVLSRQGGGIGTSGIGETNTELMKRHWRSAIKEVKDKLDKVSQNRENQLAQRKRAGFKTVSIVGYTNAGKSSLFNALTKKETLVENALFATLDSTIGKLYLKELGKEILVTDTIGFIRNLPPRLIDAFKSTLMESMHADLLLHIIDISDREAETKILIVNEILTELGRDLKDVIYVFNKIDAAPDVDKQKLLDRYTAHFPLFISAKKGTGMEDLKTTIGARLSQYSLRITNAK